MSRIVRLKPHALPELVIIDVPRDLNPDLGLFGPATLSPDAGGYLIGVDDLDAFQTFAKIRGWLVVDERPVQRRRQQLVECSRCGQPARPTQQPDYCPGCGAIYVAADDTSADPAPTRAEPRRNVCRHCSKRNARNAAHCVKCGQPLREPLRLADTLDNALPEGEPW